MTRVLDVWVRGSHCHWNTQVLENDPAYFYYSFKKSLFESFWSQQFGFTFNQHLVFYYWNLHQNNILFFFKIVVLFSIESQLISNQENVLENIFVQQRKFISVNGVEQGMCIFLCLNKNLKAQSSKFRLFYFLINQKHTSITL